MFDTGVCVLDIVICAKMDSSYISMEAMRLLFLTESFDDRIIFLSAPGFNDSVAK